MRVPDSTDFSLIPLILVICVIDNRLVRSQFHSVFKFLVPFLVPLYSQFHLAQCADSLGVPLKV